MANRNDPATTRTQGVRPWLVDQRCQNSLIKGDVRREIVQKVLKDIDATMADGKVSNRSSTRGGGVESSKPRTKSK